MKVFHKIIALISILAVAGLTILLFMFIKGDIFIVFNNSDETDVNNEVPSNETELDDGVLSSEEEIFDAIYEEKLQVEAEIFGRQFRLFVIENTPN